MLLAAIFAGAGCGHPATIEECEQIFRRNVEIELLAQDVTDPDEIERKVRDARAAKGDDLLGRCIGKRITDEAMKCVLAADTAARLDECLK